MSQYSMTAVDDIELHKRVKYIRLTTRLQLNHQRCKIRLVLLSLGLWMNLIAVTNGKWKNICYALLNTCFSFSLHS